ncbi:MAG: 50S ribosomal protein L4 [Candidatus Faecisoma sp.]|jgi:large subunit ribosomal protein L4|nr:50S ribosomal protein L4 [Acholeplasma sp.]MCI5678055.1 50S ribosomal protein L4 [Acholeplasma sp.]MDY2892611.1 50S ribosomal protein L4 [Candidatus Faecisoma sp.]CCY28062.1 50S ribosomal protein L4 [Acholeplasma sp. CAG:878]
MKKIEVLNINGEAASKIELNENIWGITPNDAVLYDALRLARNNQRQGTADTKTRSEVSGGGKKPWRQKGTGRARQGSTRAPHWPGGGIVFGPHPRSYAIKMNRKERRLALKSALAYKALESNLIVVDSFNIETSKTKDAKATLANFKTGKKVLIVVDELNDNLILSTRNLNNVLLLTVNEINTYDVVLADTMIITENALKQLEEVLA